MNVKVFLGIFLFLIITGYGCIYGREGRGNTPPYSVGHTNSMERVFKKKSLFRGSFSRTVRISSARRERESFQVVIFNGNKTLKRVRCYVSALYSKDGKHTLSSSYVTWHPVGYVKTKRCKYRGEKAGWYWPDILLPQKPFDVRKGDIQPVWFTIYVPPNTKPGVYRGFIEIKPENATSYRLILEVLVRNYTLPLHGKLKTAFSINPGMWEAWYKPDEVKRKMGIKGDLKRVPLINAPQVLPKEAWRRLYSFMLAHRVNPTNIYASWHEWGRVIPSVEDLDYCYERGQNALCLGYFMQLPKDPKRAEKNMEEMKNHLKKWHKIIKSKNWHNFVWFVHGFDESDYRKDHKTTIDPSIFKIYGMIGKLFPEIKRESANPFNPDHIGYFDIWTPTPKQWQRVFWDRQREGDMVWSYVCVTPRKPYANFFIDYPSTSARVLMWQLYKYRVQGLLYYLVNRFDTQKNWNKAAKKWPKVPWNTWSFNTNGDGMLIYPGPNYTPLASIRLENIRDGIEDYEALAILSKLTCKLEKRKGKTPLVKKCRKVLNVRDSVSSSWKEYTKDPQEIIKARQEVDDLIEQLQKEVCP